MSDTVETIESLKAQLEQTRKAQSGTDRAYAVASKRVAELERELESLNDVRTMRDTLETRIKRIESAYADKERGLELRYYARSRCLDSGVDYELIKDIPFHDEAGIDAYLERLSRSIEDRAVAHVNARLVTGEKPRAGSGEPAPKSKAMAWLDKELSGVNRGGGGF